MKGVCIYLILHIYIYTNRMTNGIWVLTHEQVSSFSVEAGPPDAGSAESVEDAFFFWLEF